MLTLYNFFLAQQSPEICFLFPVVVVVVVAVFLLFCLFCFVLLVVVEVVGRGHLIGVFLSSATSILQFDFKAARNIILRKDIAKELICFSFKSLTRMHARDDQSEAKIFGRIAINISSGTGHVKMAAATGFDSNHPVTSKFKVRSSKFKVQSSKFKFL